MRAVVTGATSGIGEAIARRLAAEGHTVTMVGRSVARLDGALRRLTAAVPGADVRGELADLSLQTEVRALAERLAALPPDVVVSNAAVMAPVDAVTDEGVPLALAVNHLAPYLLLRSLTPVVTQRFVVVGGEPEALRRVPVDLDDLGSRRGLGPVPSLRPFIQYGRTKNMNLMFVRALAARIGPGSVTVNGAHPGVVAETGLEAPVTSLLMRLVSRVVGRRSRMGVDEGADNPAWLATAPEVADVTGRYFVRRQAVDTPPHTVDAARCDRLWDESAHLVGLTT